MRTVTWLSAAVTAALLAACGSDSEESFVSPPDITPPDLATVNIVVNATGNGPVPTQLGVTLGELTYEVTPGAPGDATAATVAPGNYEAALGTLPAYCATNQATQQVSAGAGRIVTVTFTISCTGLTVVTETGGRALDAEFLVVVDDDTLSTIAGTSELLLGVAPGAHVVSLRGVASNCSVTENDRAVNLQETGDIQVPFAVACRGGAVRIAVTTSGSDTDWNGYVANVLSGTTSLAVDDLAVNGAAALGDFAAGRALTARVDGRERNCSVSPQTVAVTVPDNDTTTASFTVTCSALPVGGILFSDDGGLLSRIIPSLNGIVTIGEGSQAAWAPGGGAIAFVGGSAVHVAGPAGANVRSLIAGGSPAWTPDGSRVAFLKPARCLAGCTWPGTIDVADPAAQTMSLIPMASDADRKGIRHFDVAPNGSEVAYILSGDRTIQDALVVSNIDGSNRRILLERNFCQPGTGCSGGIFSIRYSPNGQELLANAACYSGMETEACGVIVIPVGGAAPRVLAPLSRRGWDWSPDGSQVLISQTAGGESTLLTVSSVDGSGAATVYEHDFVVTSASWAR